MPGDDRNREADPQIIEARRPSPGALDLIVDAMDRHA